MLQKIGVTDEAELRLQARKIIKTQGYTVAFQCVYEMIKAAEIFFEVIREELLFKNK